jgi:hypothetical protein
MAIITNKPEIATITPNGPKALWTPVKLYEVYAIIPPKINNNNPNSVGIIIVILIFDRVDIIIPI